MCISNGLYWPRRMSRAETDLVGYNMTDLAWHHDWEPEMRINGLCQLKRDSNSLKPIDNLFRCNEMGGRPHVPQLWDKTCTH